MRPINKVASATIFSGKLATELERQDPLPCIRDSEDQSKFWLLGGNHRVDMYRSLIAMDPKERPPGTINIDDNYEIEYRVIRDYVFSLRDRAPKAISPDGRPISWEVLRAEASAHNVAAQTHVKTTTLTLVMEIHKSLEFYKDKTFRTPTAFLKQWELDNHQRHHGGWSNRLATDTTYKVDETWAHCWQFAHRWHSVPLVWDCIWRHLKECSRVNECSINIGHLWEGKKKATDEASALLKHNSWDPLRDKFIIPMLINSCCSGEPNYHDPQSDRQPKDFSKFFELQKFLTAPVRISMHQV